MKLAIKFASFHSSHFPHFFLDQLWFGLSSEGEVFQKLNCLYDFRNLCKLMSFWMQTPFLHTSFKIKSKSFHHGP